MKVAILAYDGTEAFLWIFAMPTILVMLGVVIVGIARRPSGQGFRDYRFCPSCGTTAVPRSKLPGSNIASVALLLLFFPAFVVYEIWRRSVPPWVCPGCGRNGMADLHSPAAVAAKPLLAKPAPPPDGPGHFRIQGVDRESKLDTTWQVDAESEANARAKGELEGILVTKVERVEGWRR